MTIEITINGRFLSRRLTGVDRFALEITRALDDMTSGTGDGEEFSFRLLVPRGIQSAPDYRRIRVEQVGTRQGHYWEQLDLPRHVPAGSMLLSLCNTGPAFFPRHVVAIHDAATVRVPLAFRPAFRLWYRMLMPILGATSRSVLTVSRFAQEEIVDAFWIARDKTVIVGEGAEHIARIAPAPGILKRFGLDERPFVLAVSSKAKHKNFQLIAEALATIPGAPFNVAIAGGGNAAIFGEGTEPASDRLRWLGYVSDGELRALYESALCFVFPSIYEGFGIPPLEAMYCGCPVLAARAASIPEVCRDAAAYFDPHDARALGRLLMRLAHDAALRESMSQRGRRHVSSFTWRQAACQVIDACRKVTH